MTKTNYFKGAILVFAMLFLLPNVFAIDDFNAVSYGAKVTTCVMGVSQDKITLSNIGDSVQVYKISVDGSASKFTNIIPAQVNIGSGQTLDLQIFYNFPSWAIGDYGLKVSITDATGLEKVLSKTISSRICNDNLLAVNNFNQSSCPCLPVAYNFSMKNTGNSVESYTFSLDSFSNYAFLSNPQIILSPGQATNFQMTLKPVCNISGQFLLKFRSTAQSTGVKTEVPLLLNILRCYSYNLQSGILLNTTDSRFSAAFLPSTSGYNVCSGDRKSIQIRAQNPGYIDNIIRYALDSPSWASLNQSTINLNAQSIGDSMIDLTVPNDALGTSYILLKSISDIGAEPNQIRLTLNASHCYGVTLDVPQKKSLPGSLSSTVSFKVSNTGDKKENVLLSLNGAGFAQLSRDRLTLMPGEQKESEIIFSDVPDDSANYGFAVNAVTDNGLADSANLTVNVIPAEKYFNLKVSNKKGYTVIFEKTTIPITVTNNAFGSAESTVAVDGPSWVNSDTDNFTIGLGQKYQFNLLSEPDGNATPGDYPISYSVTTNNVSYYGDLLLKLRKEKPILNTLKDFAVYYRYWIVTIFIILVILAVLLVYISNKARVWKIRRMIKKAANRERTASQRKLEPKAKSRK